jgi:sugar lactone lactonase YvrE
MKSFEKIRALFPIAGLAFVCGIHSSLAVQGDLYVPQSAEGTVLRFSPDGQKSTFASGLDQPSGIAFDREGNLFVTQLVTGNIIKFTPSGEMTEFASGLSGPAALAFDGKGNLYVTEIIGDSGQVTKITHDGVKSIFGSYQGLEWGWPAGLAFSALGNLFVAVNGPQNIDGGIVWFAPDGIGHNFAFSSGLQLAFDTAANLYVTDDDEVLMYPPSSPGNPSVFASGFTDAIGLAFDSAGNLFVMERLSDQTSSIEKVSRDGTKILFASGLSPATSLAFEPVVEKLRNISARGLVGTGENVLIGGFIVGGSALAGNAVVVRAIGPSLSQSGVSNPLFDPTLELHNGDGAVIASNDDWQDTQKEQISAAELAPIDPEESAIYATLPAGNYTAVVRGAGDTTGTALVEVYSLE